MALTGLPQGKYQFTFISGLAGLIGIGALYACLNIAVSNYIFFHASVQASAQVMSFHREPGSKRKQSVVNARIQFKSANGEIVQADVEDVGGSDISAVGQSVAIRYLPEDPRHPRTEVDLIGLAEYITLGSSAFIFLFLGYYAGKKAEA